VTAGNAFLRNQAAAFVPAERVRFFPTCVEPERYPQAEHRRQGGATKLVWIGQRSTLPSLALAQPQLAAAARQLPGLRLKVVSDVFPELAGVVVEPRPWSSQSEAAELAEADIGISWLPDDPWSRGKCGLKVLQFMAAGLPVVANPVGANCEMVVPGETGYLARTPEEWAEAISRLAADPALRARLGAAGRRRVEEKYSVARWSGEFVGWLNQSASAQAAVHRVLAQRPPVREAAC
jgi:glycosyltransferase involved in cell wall biosynthesis